MSSLRLSIFAHHCCMILTSKAPDRFTLTPCEGVKADVKIRKSTFRDFQEDIWDNVTINGEYCGNRYGGLDHFVKLVLKTDPVLEKE